MTHYVAIVGEEFPDLPGCISAGDTVDETMPKAAKKFQPPAA